MTERLHSNPPQIATPINLGLDTFHPSESVDEEPYEIKCICDYTDDDGNTILCEKCDTWQHIECYYHGRVEDASREEFDHACVDCNPRPFDRAIATERQRKQRQLQETPEGADKKNKRRVEKSHKKKSRPSDVLINGWNGDHDGTSGRKNHSPQDHIPSKKAKSHHKSTNSIASQPGKRSPSIGTHNARNHGHGRPSSPRTLPDLPPTFEIHSYSPEFCRLYNEDPGAKQLPANAFSSLSVTNRMSSWLHDPDKREEDTGIKNTEGLFQHIVPSQNEQFYGELSREKNILVKDRWDYSPDGQKLHWRYLTTTEPRIKSTVLGELKGTVGFQSDYYKDTKNQYAVLAHPQPFVFFHPDLPIYIDTRSEGSKCRYIRRSCKANVTLDTCIVNQSEYHFCLVNEVPLTAGTQLTLPWDIHSQNKARWTFLLGLGDAGEGNADEPEMSDVEYEEITKWIHSVLSAYGGCACDLGKDCAFARFHRERFGRMQMLQAQTNGVKKRVGRPPKAKQHVSPTTTGHATNSRAPSESHPELHDDNEHESHSNSGSHRSKVRSRELSPHSLGDENNEPFGVGDELSERDKRKIAQLEEYSRRQSADIKQPPLKKKRPSGGSSANAATATAPKERAKSKGPKTSISAEPIQTNGTSTGSRKIHYADAATSRSMADSPIGLSPTDAVASQSRRASTQVSIRSRQASATASSTYRDMATQTDPVQNAWYSPIPPTPKRTHIPLARRLISYRHNARKDTEAQMRTEHASALTNGTRNTSMSSPISLPSPEIVHAQPATPIAEGRKQSILSIAESADGSFTNDVQMPDAPPIVVSNIFKPPPPPWPKTNTIPANESLNSTFKQPDLRLQLPPTTQTLDHSLQQTVATPGSVVPCSSIGVMAQSPFSAHHPSSGLSPSVITSVAPSPVKKKLSLSDYSARFSKKAPPMTDNADKNKENKPTAVSNSNLTMTPAVLRPSESLLQSSKLPGVLEGSAIVETPSAEKGDIGDPMMDVVSTSTSLQPAKTDQKSG